MKGNKYAIFLDIDETLMSNGIIPQRNIDVIKSVQQLGHKVFINTGRSYGCIPKNVLEAVKFDGFVAGIGAYIRLGDEIIQSIVIPNDILKNLADYFLSTGMPCRFEGEEETLYLNVKCEQGKLFVKDGNDLITIYKDIRISKVTIFNRLPDDAVKMLEKQFTVFQHKNYAEFGLKGCSKSSGMKVMLEHLSIGRENCIAMGDSANDIDMLQYAGISVAMGNSTDEVKKLCSFVSKTADNAGVAAALEKYVLSA